MTVPAGSTRAGGVTEGNVLGRRDDDGGRMGLDKLLYWRIVKTEEAVEGGALQVHRTLGLPVIGTEDDHDLELSIKLMDPKIHLRMMIPHDVAITTLCDMVRDHLLTLECGTFKELSRGELKLVIHEEGRQCEHDQMRRWKAWKNSGSVRSAKSEGEIKHMEVRGRGGELWLCV